MDIKTFLQHIGGGGVLLLVFFFLPPHQILFPLAAAQVSFPLFHECLLTLLIFTASQICYSVFQIKDLVPYSFHLPTNCRCLDKCMKAFPSPITSVWTDSETEVKGREIISVKL